MMLLALDTSSLACSVALECEGTIIERHELKPREHTNLLLPMIRAVIDEAGAEITDIDALILGNGPGSFIGVRIAASVAQGLAFASSIDIVPVSSLAALAAEVFATTPAETAVVTQDAHMGEVYLGIFGRGAEDLPEPLVPERLCGPEHIAELESRPARSCVAAGHGWQACAGLLSVNAGFFHAVSSLAFPRARYLLGLGAAGLANSQAVKARDLDLAYLRQQVAKSLHERRNRTVICT